MRLLIVSLLLLGACASSGTHLGEEHALSLLTVRNQRAGNLTIYVMHEGYRGRRLGEVTSLGSSTFVLDELDAPPATDLQFLAVSFADGVSELSDPVHILRGSTYEWRLAPFRGHQLAFRRNSST
ncbi:MAG TPA: hypothetical protein VGH98_02860 [Gemmatimonadaceae bacterium]|jgi:hypothetical protein